MISFIKCLLHDQSGQDMIEYALIAALIGLGALTTHKSFETTFVKDLKNLTKSIKKYT